MAPWSSRPIHPPPRRKNGGGGDVYNRTGRPPWATFRYLWTNMGTTRGHHPLRTILFALIYFASASAKQCKLGCVGTEGTLFKYETGTKYKYELDGVSVTTLAGAESDVSKMTVKATAEVAALPDCTYSLTLENLQITGNDGKAVPGVTSKPILFGMNNGIVSSEICAAPDEDNASLNIKRAIVSLIQTGGSTGPGFNLKTESDVFGDCPTDINVSKAGSKVKVKKSRNLNMCHHRSNVISPVTAVEYESISDVQNSPLLTGSQKVEQVVDGGVVKTASSQEEYHYSPISAVGPGAKVTVSTKLKLVSSAKGAAPPAGITNAKTIHLETATKTPEDMTATATKLLKEVCSTATPVIASGNSAKFSSLVKLLSLSNKATMTNLFSQIKSGAICSDKESGKKILLDAISQTHSAAGIEVMAELLKNKDVTGTKAKMWYIALGLVNHASLNSLKAAEPLLDGEAPVEAYLGIGELVGKYCRDHTCEGVQIVDQVSQKLAAPLMKGCKVANVKEEDKLIGSLKGLGNTHFLPASVVSKLTACAADHSVKSRVRSAVLDTLRSDPNKSEIKKVATDILKDKNEDSELRIKAYLIIVECPCPKMVALIQEVLDNEESFQVGSYIISHLRNLRSTKNPMKQKASTNFSKVKTSDKFPFDPRKFSQNEEFSYLFETLNVGTAGEGNLIYSQKSWVPRFVSLNLTTQIFGKSFNLLELDARAENIETLIEKVFGPKGYFQSTSENDVVSDVSTMFGQFMAKAKQSVRPKRGVSKDQIDAFAKKVDMGVDAGEKELNLDLSLKSGGSELSWVALHGGDMAQDPNSVMDKLFGIFDQAVDKAKNIDFDYKKHAILMEGTVEYPTGMGVPLKLHARAASAVRVKFDGKFDLPALARDPKNAIVRFQIIPSASVALVGVITMDAKVVDSGMKVIINLHSSTGSDFTARVLDGKGVDVKIGLPIDKQDIITAESEIYGFTTVKDVKTKTQLKFNTKREKYSGCFDQVNALLGLTFCGEVDVPWEGYKSLSPAYGPAHLTLHVEKEDDSINAFHFKAFYNIQKDSPQRSFELSFETPNSKKEHKFSLLLESSDSPQKYVKAVAESPWGGAKIEGSIVDSPSEHSINAEVSFADQEYVFKAGVKGSGSGKYEPFLDYRSPEKGKTSLVGRRGGPKQTAQVTVSGEVLVDQDKAAKSTKYTLNSVKVNTGRQEFVLDGSISAKPKTIDVDLKVSYDKDNVIIKASDAWDFNKEATTYWFKRHLQLAFTQQPDLGMDITWNFNSALKSPKTLLEGEFILIHGPDPKSEAARVTIKNHYSQVITDIDTFQIKNLVTYPLFGVVAKANGKVSDKEIGYELEGAFDKYKAGSNLNIQLKGKGQYEMELDGHVMDNSLHATAKREIVGADKSKFTNSLELKPGGKYQLNALVTHKVKQNDVDLLVDSKLTIPTDPKTLEVKAGVKENAGEMGAILLINAGGKNLIDAKGRVKKGSAPSGNFKVTVPNHFDSSGNFKTANNVFDGKASLNMIKAQKKLETKARMTLNAPKYQGNLDVCMDAKCLKMTTNTHFTPENYDTANTVEFNNIKIDLKSKHDHAKGTLSAQSEVHLPNGRNIKANYARTLNVKPKNTDAEYSLDLEDVEAGKGPRKLSGKFIGKHIDLETLQFDGQATATYTTPDGKDLSLHTNMKKMPNGDKWNINGEVGVSGSMISDPLKASFESEVSEKLFEGDFGDDMSIPPISYHLSATAGSDGELESHGKANTHTISGEVTVKLPKNQDIKQIKWITSNVVDVVPKQGARGKVKTSNTLKWGDNKFLKSNVEVNQEDYGLSYKMDWEGDSLKKRTLSGSGLYKHGHGKEPCQAGGAIALFWEGKTADVTGKMEADGTKRAVSLQLSGTLPDQKKFNIDLKGNEVTDPADTTGKGVHGDLTATIGNSKYTGHSKIELFKNHPLIDISLDHPDGKSVFKYAINKFSDRHWTGESYVKWTNNGGGSFKSNSEINIESIDDFIVKAEMDSSILNINKMEILAKGTPEKELELLYKREGKTVASGKVNYKIAEEGSKKSVSGSGNLNIQGTDYPLNYDGNCEAANGLKCELNAKAGERSLEIRSKNSPTEYVVTRKYCKDASTCSEAAMVSTIKAESPLKFEHNLEMKFDYSLFNPKLHDVLIKSNTKRDGLTFDQTVDVEFSPESKVQYVSYVHANKAGATLTLPKRTIAAEASYAQPKQNKLKAEASLWLDKAKSPNKRAHVQVAGEATHNKDTYAAVGEVKFSHPSLARSLSVKGSASYMDKKGKPSSEGSLEVDIFKTPQQKIVAGWKMGAEKRPEGYNAQGQTTVKSEGLGIDSGYEITAVMTKSSIAMKDKLSYLDSKKKKHALIGDLEITPSKAHLIGKSGDKVLVEIVGKMNKDENAVTFQNSINWMGAKYTEILELKKPFSYNYKMAFGKGCKNKVLTSEGDYTFGKAAKVGAAFDGKQFADFELSLQEASFFKPTYKYDTETAKALWQCVVDDANHMNKDKDNTLEKLRTLATEEGEAKLKTLKEALPDVQPLLEAYTGQLSQIQEEILSDKTLQGSLQLLKESLSTVIEQVVVFLEEINKLYATASSEITDFLSKLEAALKEFQPRLDKMLEDLGNALHVILEDALNFSVQMSDIILDQIKAHEDEIKAVLNTIGDAMEEFGKVFAKFAGKLNEAIQQIIQETIAMVSDLPVSEMLKDYMEQFKEMDWDVFNIKGLLPEVIEVVQSLLEEIKDAAPTIELKKLMGTISEWLNKILKNDKVNHIEYAKKVSDEFVAAIQPIVTQVYDQISGDSQALGKKGLPFFQASPFTRFPPGILKISTLSWLMSSDFPSVDKLIAAFVPPLNPSDWLPPYPARAHLLGGSEVITFDGKHINVQGDCQYILTEDFIDGNFSVIATLQGGNLAAIQVTVGQDTVELRHDKKPLVNGKESEFPIAQGAIKSWRRPNVVGLKTKTGVKIICAPDCSRCRFKLSGFYFGKVRGLLGTYNYEQYEDMTLPGGQVSKDNDKFLKEWSIGDSCKGAKSNKEAKVDFECEEMFDETPEFAFCNIFVDPTPYKAACYELAGKESNEEGKKAAACTVAHAYTSICQNRVPTILPLTCVKCEVEGKGKIDFGDDVDMKPPYKQADVVFAIQQSEANKEVFDNLVVPLVPILTNDLKAKGFTDIKFSVVGFGGKRGWPAYYTNDGKIASDSINKDLQFDPAPATSENDNPLLKMYKQTKKQIAIETGMTMTAITYTDIPATFEFRPGAARTVIGVHSSKCLGSNIFALLQHAFYIGTYLGRDIAYNMISPVENIKIEGKDAAKVVGFDLNDVFMLGDTEMKGEDDNILSHSYDPCHTFAKFTGGKVFSANNFLAASGGDRQTFIKSVSTGIASSVAAMDDERDCMCALNMNYYDGINPSLTC